MSAQPRTTRYVTERQGGDHIVVERRTGIVSGRFKTLVEAAQYRDELNRWWEVKPGRAPIAGWFLAIFVLPAVLAVIVGAIVLFWVIANTGSVGP